MSEQARYQVGDPVGSIRMRNAAGDLIDYAHQSLAGRALVLYLATGDESTDFREHLQRLFLELAAMETLCAVVVADPARPISVPQPAEMLIDSEGACGVAFGLRAPALILLGADSRVRALIPGDDLAAAGRLAALCHGASSPEIAPSQAPVLLIENVLEAELCKAMIEYWERGPKRTDTVSSTRQGSAAQVATVKRRGDVIIEDKSIVAVLRQRMQARILGEIRKIHHMEIVGHEAFRIGCYDAGEQGFFGRHRDNATPYTAHRRYALTLNLNQDYLGGELRFPEYGRMLYRPPSGGAVVFSCALLHEALPVTRGRRFVLLSFFFDREGAKQEQERLAKENAIPAKS